MHIHLKGGDIKNRGDQLMLRTVVDQLNQSKRDAKIGTYNYYVPYALRATLGLRQTLWFPNYRRISGLIGYPVLKRYRDTLGLIAPEDIDWILDLSGYCYTEYWGAENAINMQKYLTKQARHDSRYIILPQAFGPFDNDRLREAALSVFDQAALLFVRDDRSKQYVEDLGVSVPITKAPDLTTIAPTEVPSWCESQSPFTCIVPNSRMIEQRDDSADAYVRFLALVCRRLETEGRNVLFLLFEKRDQEILHTLCDRMGRQIQFVKESNPVRLRGIIGAARAVVASRYHALVSALSQGVPSVGTSWSHKYEELFSDYGCSQLIVDDLQDTDHIHEVVDTLSDAAHYDPLREQLSSQATLMQNRAKEMWKTIGHTMGLSGVGSKPSERSGPAPQVIRPNGQATR